MRNTPTDLPWHKRRLWDIQVVRDVARLILIALAVYSVVLLNSVTVPLGLALVLAFMVEPIVVFAERLGVHRLVTSVSLATGLLGLFTIGIVFVAPVVVHEIDALLRRLPGYFSALQQWVGQPMDVRDEFTRQLTEAPQQVLRSVLTGTRSAVGVLSQFLGAAGRVLVGTVFTLLLFIAISTRYQHVPSIQQLPIYDPNKRWAKLAEATLEVFAGFLRGQLLVAFFTTLVFSVGFYALGIPFWVLPAAVGGVLSIVPYGQIAGPATAIALNLAEHEGAIAGITAVELVGYPVMVYAIMQSLETFVVTPLVQGSTVRLPPLAVLGAVIAGGNLGGLVGVFLAIPIAATARVFVVEVLIPWATDLGWLKGTILKGSR